MALKMKDLGIGIYEAVSSKTRWCTKCDQPIEAGKVHLRIYDPYWKCRVPYCPECSLQMIKKLKKTVRKMQGR